MFDAVLFDLDETLILDEPVSRHAFFVVALEACGDEAVARRLAQAAERQARELWRELPPVAVEYSLRIGHSPLEGLWARYDERLEPERVLQAELTRLRPELWRRALAEVGVSADPRACEQRWEAVRAQYPLFTDTDELLARLRPRTKLAIVTNGVAGLQRRKVDGSGLAHWFDVVAISGEVGIGKPERGIFDWVCERLGVRPERCAMVGDNPERDVQGGKNAGLRTAWVDRGLKARTVPADVDVTSLAQLLPWLERG